jgi:hypothetical protein
MVRGQPDIFCFSLAKQAAGQRIVLFHQRPAACGGLGSPGQGGGAEQADLGGQRGRVRGVPSLADRLADELLHPDERFGRLRGPAPLAWCAASVTACSSRRACAQHS